MGAMSDTMMGGQPSPEEMRAYLEQLREADAAGLVAEAYNLLAAGAQVKLGRSDARTLIDAMSALTQVASPALPQELAQQMTQGVQQLQLAQVEAERQVAAETQQQATASEETGAQTGTQAAPTAPPQQAQQRMTDRLWIPGRDAGPPPPPQSGR